MTFTRAKSLLFCVAAAPAIACSDPGMTCNPNLPVNQPTIVIAVVDSASGQPIADSATGSFASTGVSDSLWHDPYHPDSLLESNLVPADTYAAAIVRPGYRQWLKSGIVVTAGGTCSAVSPVNITARLQPSP